jgi:GNAT superfamily N-acetyltransferase
MHYSIEYESSPKRTETIKLSQGIADYARQMKGHASIEEFAFFIRDPNETILGGCNGAMYYGCLYIDQLWVDESLRKQGYGTKLMQKAEELGKEKNCLFSTVNTMDWEGLDFYRKLGYYIEFERRGYVKDSTFYFLRKDF